MTILRRYEPKQDASPPYSGERASRSLRRIIILLGATAALTSTCMHYALDHSDRLSPGSVYSSDVNKDGIEDLIVKRKDGAEFVFLKNEEGLYTRLENQLN